MHPRVSALPAKSPATAADRESVGCEFPLAKNGYGMGSGMMPRKAPTRVPGASGRVGPDATENRGSIELRLGPFLCLRSGQLPDLYVALFAAARGVDCCGLIRTLVPRRDSRCFTTRAARISSPSSPRSRARSPSGGRLERLGDLRAARSSAGDQDRRRDKEYDPAFARLALAAGATGFVSKDLADSELPSAVRAAARDERYISPRVAARLSGRGWVIL